MSEYLWWAGGALVVGLLAGYLAGQRRAAIAAVEAAGARMRADEIERQSHSIEEDRRRLLEQVQTFTGELATERQKTAGLEDMRASLKAEIENLAASILEDKSRRFTEQNRTQLEQLLGPLGERLKEFQIQVSQAYGDENKARHALTTEVRRLSELNQTVSREAGNLAQALKGQSKTRGNWGEMILESVLEKAGLIRGQHFHTQVSDTSSEGRRLQPDVVVDLPGDRQVIIDAKVSLNAYERQCSAQTDEERSAAAKEHADSLRRHIEQLSGKNYSALPGIKSPDFVFLFVPVEPALHAALETAPDLIDIALQKNIVLATAPNIIATVRLVAQLWQQDSQNRFAKEIAEQGGRLYDKFVAFCRDLEGIGQRIRQTQESYDEAMGKLRDGRGNLLRQTEKLRALGAKTTAQPPALLEGTEEG
ncbi:MAG: DNA recombination protein RmuC [Chthoniobacterales bacterium]|nr:DNA recombination protein RmuC [Chthoniobacterales bacterium]